MLQTMASQVQYSQEVEKLFAGQMDEWPLMAANYRALDQIRLKKLQYFGFFLKVQFNPARIKSSSAKVDKTSIGNRACFLCASNRPTEQKAVPFRDDYLILVNPFPIFPKHLTITHTRHIPQTIKNHFEAMLELSKSLPDYTVFYNGPRCGASAPDHFHFQAGNKNHMPLENQIDVLRNDFGKLYTMGNCRIWKIDDMIRRFFLIESEEQDELEKAFNLIYDKLLMIKPLVDEPDLNILCSYRNKTWKLILFPRGAHRPWQYFAEGDNNILFSPASVDLGGLLIVPLEKDFENMDSIAAWGMLRQVGLSEDQFNEIKI